MSTVPPRSAMGSTPDALTPRRRTGRERFHRAGKPMPARLLHFWQWAYSEVCHDEVRKLIAEYLVGMALDTLADNRADWDAWDVRTASGLKIEVSSAGYLQSWQQPTLSPIWFDIAPPQGGDPRAAQAPRPIERSADVYVFALHAHQDKDTLDPLDVAQWRFFVVPTHLLDQRHPHRKRLGLESVQRLVIRSVEHAELAREVETVAASIAREVHRAPMAPLPESSRIG